MMSAFCVVPRSTAFSMITQLAPISTGPPSAATTAPCMMQVPRPVRTSPARKADMTVLDTGTEDLRAEIDGGVAVITMNRPDRRNAFSHAMVSALGTVLAQVETDEAVGSV